VTLQPDHPVQQPEPPDIAGSQAPHLPLPVPRPAGPLDAPRHVRLAPRHADPDHRVRAGPLRAVVYHELDHRHAAVALRAVADAHEAVAEAVHEPARAALAGAEGLLDAHTNLGGELGKVESSVTPT